MKVIDLKTARPLDGAGDLKAFDLYREERFHLVYLILDPGEKVEAHVSNFKVLFYVIEGEALFEIDGKEIVLSQEQILEVLRGVSRALKNIGNKPLRILVMKLIEN